MIKTHLSQRIRCFPRLSRETRFFLVHKCWHEKLDVCISSFSCAFSLRNIYILHNFYYFFSTFSLPLLRLPLFHLFFAFLSGRVSDFFLTGRKRVSRSLNSRSVNGTNEVQNNRVAGRSFSLFICIPLSSSHSTAISLRAFLGFPSCEAAAR